jgi:hypothetical protein
MSGTVFVLLILWIPSTLFAVFFLWPGFREEVINKPKERTTFQYVVFSVGSLVVFAVLCAVVGPFVVWQMLTELDTEEE